MTMVAAPPPTRRRRPLPPAPDTRTPEYLGALNRLGRAFWNSAVLNAAVTLDVFAALGRTTHTTSQLAAALDCDTRYLESLLNACAMLGLVERNRRGYRNSPLALTALLPGQPVYQGDMVLHRHDIWQNWGRLAEAVRNGAPLPLDLPTAADRSRFAHTYALAHDNLAAGGQAQQFVAATPLPVRGHVLDIGGGAASYSIAACRARRSLTATVVELPDVADVARAKVNEAGLADRISVVEADYTGLDFPRADVVLFSAILCQERSATRSALLGKAFVALPPGGLMVVQDALRMPQQEQKAELLAVFDVLTLLLYNAEAGVVTGDEAARWLRSAGFGPARQKPLPGLFSIVYARRPQER